MSQDRSLTGNLTGSLLIAHPSLQDPNFRRTILFISHHSAEDGAVGLVLNRPLGQSLGEISETPLSDSLMPVEAFFGGPVATDQVTVASLQWCENPSAVTFHSYTGRVDEIEVTTEWKKGAKAFVGYAGWTSGQLENEIAQKAWIVLSPTRTLIEMTDPEGAWHELMRESGPLLRLLSEAPDHPEWN
jgi:putative transcriptional regulator